MKLSRTLHSIIFLVVLFIPALTFAQEQQPESRASILDAARSGDLKQVKLLIASGADLNFGGKGHETPLMAAVSKRHPAVVDALLTAGADVNLESILGWTPLMWAIETGSPEIVKRLLSAHANVNARSSRSGRTALMLAVIGQEGNYFTKMLVDAGADVNVTDNNGQTALTRAVLDYGEQKAIKVLLDAGAKVNLRDKHGKRALDYAIEREASDTVSLLRRYGARRGV